MSKNKTLKAKRRRILSEIKQWQEKQDSYVVKGWSILLVFVHIEMQRNLFMKFSLRYRYFLAMNTVMVGDLAWTRLLIRVKYYKRWGIKLTSMHTNI